MTDAMRLRLNQAMSLYAANRLPESEAEFRALVDVPDLRGQALAGIGLIKYRQGDKTQAELVFKQALESGPNGDADYGLGVISEDRERYGDALLHYQRASIAAPHLGASKRLTQLTERLNRRSLAQDPPPQGHQVHQGSHAPQPFPQPMPRGHQVVPPVPPPQPHFYQPQHPPPPVHQPQHAPQPVYGPQPLPQSVHRPQHDFATGQYSPPQWGTESHHQAVHTHLPSHGPQSTPKVFQQESVGGSTEVAGFLRLLANDANSPNSPSAHLSRQCIDFIDSIAMERRPRRTAYPISALLTILLGLGSIPLLLFVPKLLGIF